MEDRKNNSDTLACGSCATSLFLRHFDIICDLLLNRRTATWNLFVKLIKIIAKCFECKIIERVLLTGTISICKRFSKVSHRSVSPCNFYFLNIYIMTYNTRFVLQTNKWHNSTSVFDNKTYL